MNNKDSIVERLGKDPYYQILDRLGNALTSAQIGISSKNEELKQQIPNFKKEFYKRLKGLLSSNKYDPEVTNYLVKFFDYEKNDWDRRTIDAIVDIYNKLRDEITKKNIIK